MKTVNSFMSYVQENRRIVTAVMCVCLLLSMCLATQVVFAEETSETNTNAAISAIEGAVTYIVDNLYQLMRAIIIPIVSLFLGWAGLQFAIGGAKGTEKAMQIFKNCFAATAFVLFAPLIGEAFGNMLKGAAGDGSISNHNPYK